MTRWTLVEMNGLKWYSNLSAVLSNRPWVWNSDTCNFSRVSMTLRDNSDRNMTHDTDGKQHKKRGFYKILMCNIL